MKTFFYGKTRLLNSHPFEIMFLTFKPHENYSIDYLRIVNDNYIEHCEKKIVECAVEVKK